MQCRYCHGEIEDDSKFCVYCGKSQEEPVSKPEDNLAGIGAGEVAAEKKRGFSIKDGVILGVILLAVAGAVLMAVSKGDKAGDKAEAVMMNETSVTNLSTVTTTPSTTVKTAATTTAPVTEATVQEVNSGEKYEAWERFVKYHSDVSHMNAIDYLSANCNDIKSYFGPGYADTDENGSTMTYPGLPFDFVFSASRVSEHAVGYSVPIWVTVDGANYGVPVTPEIKTGMNLSDIEKAMGTALKDNLSINAEHDGNTHAYFDYGEDYSVDIVWKNAEDISRPFAYAKVEWKNWAKQESLSKNYLLGDWHDDSCSTIDESCILHISDAEISIDGETYTWELLDYSVEDNEESFIIRVDFLEYEVRMMFIVDPSKNTALMYMPSLVGGYTNSGKMERVNHYY